MFFRNLKFSWLVCFLGKLPTEPTCFPCFSQWPPHPQRGLLTPQSDETDHRRSPTSQCPSARCPMPMSWPCRFGFFEGFWGLLRWGWGEVMCFLFFCLELLEGFQKYELWFFDTYIYIYTGYGLGCRYVYVHAQIYHICVIFHAMFMFITIQISIIIIIIQSFNR